MGVVRCIVKGWPLTSEPQELWVQNRWSRGYDNGIRDERWKVTWQTVWRQHGPLHHTWSLERARTKCRSKRRWRCTVECQLQDTGFRKRYGGLGGEHRHEHAWPLRMTQLHYFNISGITLKRTQCHIPTYVSESSINVSYNSKSEHITLYLHTKLHMASLITFMWNLWLNTDFTWLQSYLHTHTHTHTHTYTHTLSPRFYCLLTRNFTELVPGMLRTQKVTQLPCCLHQCHETKKSQVEILRYNYMKTHQHTVAYKWTVIMV